LNDNRRMPARLSAFVIWTLVAASATFWGLRLLARSAPAPAHAVAVGDSSAARGDLTRLFGVPPVVPTAAVATPQIASRFKLTGVMAPKKSDRYGIALISVDGKLPRAFNVGSRVDGDLVLQSVSLRTAAIGPVQGRAAVVLELPPLPPPATGTLPPNPGVPMPGAAAPVQAPTALPVPPEAQPASPTAAPPPRFAAPRSRRQSPDQSQQSQ